PEAALADLQLMASLHKQQLGLSSLPPPGPQSDAQQPPLTAQHLELAKGQPDPRDARITKALLDAYKRDDGWHCPKCGQTFTKPTPFAQHLIDELNRDLYKLGYTTMGTFGCQTFTYQLPELKEVKYRSVAPYVSAHYEGLFILPTHPPSFDWEAIKSPGPPYLWAYHVHQPTGEAWGECFSWRAFTLLWRKISPDTFSITISLGSLHREDVLYLNTYGSPPIIWRITRDILGNYHTDPPQHTCRYRIAPWEILSYED
ncbi:unnamed protein product, partial [marine sediment metagenome]